MQIEEFYRQLAPADLALLQRYLQRRRSEQPAATAPAVQCCAGHPARLQSELYWLRNQCAASSDRGGANLPYDCRKSAGPV